VLETARDADRAKRILAAHLILGPEKPLSYLPNKTIENMIGIKVVEYVAMIEKSGFAAVALSDQECCIDSGAVYAYSCQHLDSILIGNQSLLLSHGWPVASVDFIRRLAAEWLEEGHPLLPAIERAFGESRCGIELVPTR
jgi:hypothetical protein